MGKIGFNRKLLKYSVKEDFFKKWSSQMAYVLGFTFADGNIHRTSLSWDIQKRDLDILRKLNNVFQSTYPIKERGETSYRLRINNQKLIEGAIKKGLLPKKSLRVVFPEVPETLTRHFVRGYLDGDGWITNRSGRNEVDLGFVCGNKEFLSTLLNIFEKTLKVTGRVRTKIKITPKGFKSTTYLLEYYSSSAVEIADWLYKDMKAEDLYLERKHHKYLDAKIIYNKIFEKMKTKKQIQREFRKPMADILLHLHAKQHLNGMQISKVLGTSKSSVYRWLESTGV